MVVARVASALLPAPELAQATDQGPTARWVDDYYTVEALDERTFAIGEPRYAQRNFSYLIVGSERAVLFDAGPGVRDIRPIAESLTDRPITFIPSHFHFDHLGDGISFSSIAVVDLPYLRERADDDQLALTHPEHLGFAEGFALPTLRVTEWIAPGETISLGDRSLLVIHTPGHTPDSISLVETATGLIFSGDFVYPGPLFAFLPGSAMGDYLEGAEAILHSAPNDPRILGAHRSELSGLPELTLGDVEDLETLLEGIRMRTISGEGVYPVIYEVNDQMTLWAEPRWLQRW
jgi:glyoxylase-like metal-dependent hydrolase (beta-lactamase superfamily II)